MPFQGPVAGEGRAGRWAAPNPVPVVLPLRERTKTNLAAKRGALQLLPPTHSPLHQRQQAAPHPAEPADSQQFPPPPPPPLLLLLLLLLPLASRIGVVVGVALLPTKATKTTRQPVPLFGAHSSLPRRTNHCVLFTMVVGA